MDFIYQSEKFSLARRALVLPFSKGEAESIAYAFDQCDAGLHDLDMESIGVDAGNWVDKIRELMDTKGLSDPDDRGLWIVKADSLTVEQKIELSRAVDKLADYFLSRMLETKSG